MRPGFKPARLDRALPFLSLVVLSLLSGCARSATEPAFDVLITGGS